MAKRLAVQSVVAAIRLELQRTSNRTLSQMKRAMGARLIELIREAYMIKARGGMDIAGQAWKPTAAFKRAESLILYRSGKLFRGFKFRETSDGFQIYNDVDYSQFAFNDRPPWSRKLPDEWSQELADVARPFLAEITARAIRNKFRQSSVSIK